GHESITSRERGGVAQRSRHTNRATADERYIVCSSGCANCQVAVVLGCNCLRPGAAVINSAGRSESNRSKTSGECARRARYFEGGAVGDFEGVARAAGDGETTIVE